MDYFFVLCRVSGENLELSEVKSTIHDLGLERFSSALMWIMGHVFGLPEEQMPWTPDEKDGQFLLNEVMTSGNFGRHDKKQRERKAKAGYGLFGRRPDCKFIINT